MLSSTCLVREGSIRTHLDSSLFQDLLDPDIFWAFQTSLSSSLFLEADYKGKSSLAPGKDREESPYTGWVCPSATDYFGTDKKSKSPVNQQIAYNLFSEI